MFRRNFGLCNRSFWSRKARKGITCYSCYFTEKNTKIHKIITRKVIKIVSVINGKFFQKRSFGNLVREICFPSLLQTRCQVSAHGQLGIHVLPLHLLAIYYRQVSNRPVSQHQIFLCKTLNISVQSTHLMHHTKTHANSLLWVHICNEIDQT